MSTARNYRIRAATDAEREYRSRRNLPCASWDCGAPVTHYTGFDFTAGDSGRTASSKSAACTRHAAAFAARHGLTMPEEVGAA